MKSFYKYIFVFFVSFMLLTSAVTVAVNAEQPQKPTISAQSVTTQMGEDIFVKIDVSSNPGVAFALIEVEYSDELNLIDIWDEGCFGSPLFENDLDANPVHLSWDHSEDGDNALDGTLATLHFVLKDDAQAGTYWVKISYDEENIFNSDLQNVYFDTVEAQVTVTEPVEPENFPWIVIVIIVVAIAVAAVILLLLKKKKQA